MSSIPRREQTVRENIHYVIAKLEEIHTDVNQLKEHVDELRQEAAGRRAIQRFTLATMGIIGATLGWLVDNFLSLAKGGKF